MSHAKRVIPNDEAKRPPKNRWSQYVGETETHYLTIVVYAAGGTGYLVYAVPKDEYHVVEDEQQAVEEFI
jgi:hypothetical protein